VLAGFCAALCRKNRDIGYILADSWFASNENMRFIAGKEKLFIFEVKANRLVATSERERKEGKSLQTSL
jgi:hypothetical protein